MSALKMCKNGAPRCNRTPGIKRPRKKELFLLRLSIHGIAAAVTVAEVATSNSAVEHARRGARPLCNPSLKKGKKRYQHK